MPRFKHLPLASATNEIRLLSLDPSGDLGDIHCTLVTHRLDVQPVYCALSYEWGDPDLPMEIKVNGNVFHARHNLWLFLHRLKAARRSQGKASWGPTSKLWIDALCIDQTDLAERSAQVQLMGTIYQKACGVIVWLGWSDGLDPAVTLTLAKEIASDPVYGHKSYSDLLLNGPCQHIDVDDEATIQQVCDFILHLCKKTYWTRRWIVQEILVAQKVLLVYGEQELPFAAVCMKFKRYYNLCRMYDNGENPVCYGTELSSMKKILETTAAKIWTHQNMREGSKSGTNLATLLQDYRSLQCEAVHDKVYALKGLATDGILSTDYSISALELFSRVFTIMLQQEFAPFRNWRTYAADCGLVVQPPPLTLTNTSAQEQSDRSMTLIPFKTACEACVMSTMEFTMFEQAVAKVNLYLDSPWNSTINSSIPRANLGLERPSGIVSGLRETLDNLSRSRQFGSELLRTSVKHVGSEENAGAASHDATFRGETRILTATTIGDERPNGENAPTIIFCGKVSPDRTSYLSITWSNVEAGDVLCRVFDSCYLILRQDGKDFKIVGKAWLLLRDWDSAVLQQCVTGPKHRYEMRDDALWDDLFQKSLSKPTRALIHFDESPWKNLKRRNFQIQFDVMELIQLIQVTEQMMKFTRWCG